MSKKISVRDLWFHFLHAICENSLNLKLHRWTANTRKSLLSNTRKSSNIINKYMFLCCVVLLQFAHSTPANIISPFLSLARSTTTKKTGFLGIESMLFCWIQLGSYTHGQCLIQILIGVKEKECHGRDSDEKNKCDKVKEAKALILFCKWINLNE